MSDDQLHDQEDEPIEGPGPGPHPLVGRQTALVLALRWLGIAAWVLALLGVVLPGRAGDVAAVALVVLLIVAPIARVGWLAVRWTRRGDPRYAIVAGALVLVALSGGLLAR